jgi:lysophospholipase L1-like esterase
MPFRLAVILLAVVSTLSAQSTATQPKPVPWVATWAASPFAGDPWHWIPTLTDTTLREIVHTSIGGTSVRVRFSNEIGTDPLRIDAATVALSAGVSSVDSASLHDLTFGGLPSIVVPPGAVAVSDPVAMATSASADLAISFHLPLQQISNVTAHSIAQQDNFVETGNHVNDASFAAPVVTPSWYFLKSVDVLPADADAAAIVAFGDSITDGAQSTPNVNHRWPDFLFSRLQGNPATSHIAVLDQGLGGNCVLTDCIGPNALARFDRDVLSQAGVKYVVLFESINDINELNALDTPRPANYTVTAADLEQGLAQIVARAHSHGISVFGATITPYQGFVYYTDSGEQIRQAVNQWILTSGVFDGTIDFAKAMGDPANPFALAPQYDSGDHLHPVDLGYLAMADCFDLNVFD